VIEADERIARREGGAGAVHEELGLELPDGFQAAAQALMAAHAEA
jgi:hypothetical protein